jgi:predicted  nucleic acid-binding Zn-ribbon protein
MNIEKILEYQNLDTQIKKLEEALENNADQKAMNSLKKVVQETQSISANLEKEAEKTIAEFNKMKKNYSEATSALERLDQSQTNNYTEKQCAECVKQLNNIANFLASLEKVMRQTAEKINSILVEYDAAKKNYEIAKRKHASHKQNLETLKEKIQPQLESLQKDLAKMEQGLEDKFIKKYKTKRQDKIFPVVVQLRGNACGGCGMELPSAQIEKLKKDGFLECENERCHRIIYFKN